MIWWRIQTSMPSIFDCHSLQTFPLWKTNLVKFVGLFAFHELLFYPVWLRSNMKIEIAPQKCFAFKIAKIPLGVYFFQIITTFSKVFPIIPQIHINGLVLLTINVCVVLKKNTSFCEIEIYFKFYTLKKIVEENF